MIDDSILDDLSCWCRAKSDYERFSFVVDVLIVLPLSVVGIAGNALSVEMSLSRRPVLAFGLNICVVGPGLRHESLVLVPGLDFEGLMLGPCFNLVCLVLGLGLDGLVIGPGLP